MTVCLTVQYLVSNGPFELAAHYAAAGNQTT